jgi:hypothetical protein
VTQHDKTLALVGGLVKYARGRTPAVVMLTIDVRRHGDDAVAPDRLDFAGRLARHESHGLIDEQRRARSDREAPDFGCRPDLGCWLA